MSAVEEEQKIHGARLGIRILAGILVLGGVCAFLGFHYRSPLEELGRELVQRWGLWFVFYGVLVVDFSPLPLINEPVMGLGLAGGLSTSWIALAASLGSLLAAWGGYFCGRGLNQLGLTHRLLGDRLERAQTFVSRYGFWGIAIPALTPLPFAICAWSAGALRMPLLPFGLGVLFRIPKVVFYLMLVEQTWLLGGS